MATQGLWRRSRDSLENFNEAFLRSQPRFLESRLHEVCLEPFALVRGPTEFTVGGNIESVASVPQSGAPSPFGLVNA